MSSPEPVKVAKGVIPANTGANLDWAIKNFKKWASNRSTTAPSNPVPPDLLKSHDPELLRKWLSQYVMETRSTYGT